MWEVVKVVLKCNVVVIIIVYNYFFGECILSDVDCYLIRCIELVCDLVDIWFVDYIIVGKGDYFFFEEEKWEMF